MDQTILLRQKIGFPSKKGWGKAKAIFTKDSLIISGHEVMQKWEKDYMKILADIATKKNGKILEVGYGLGIATSFIQEHKNVKKHTIIEFHPDVIKRCQKDWPNEIKSGKIKLLKGFWEDIVPKLPSESFDGILFDTYPLTEKQLHKNHFDFFKQAYRLLKKGGIFTYYSDESKDFSNEHLKKLREAGFTKIDGKICRINPPKNSMYWRHKTILAPIITK